MLNNYSVRTRLTILALLPLVVFTLSSFFSINTMERLVSGIDSLYDDRVVPLKQIKNVSDNYAVNIVDLFHKYRAGTLNKSTFLSAINEAKTIADKSEQILRAEGEAKAIIAVAEAQADALRKVGEAADTEQGQKAIQLDLATKAIAAKEAIARESSVVLLPDNGTDASSLVAQGMSIINTLNQKQKS